MYVWKGMFWIILGIALNVHLLPFKFILFTFPQFWFKLLFTNFHWILSADLRSRPDIFKNEKKISIHQVHHLPEKSKANKEKCLNHRENDKYKDETDSVFDKILLFVLRTLKKGFLQKFEHINEI